MKTKKLTIGMATYDDFDGIFFSIKAIRLYHPEILKDVEFLIIDNNPDGEHSEAVKTFLKEEVPEKCRYIPYRGKVTSFTKYKVFELAQTPYVLCMDCHVLFEKGSLKKLLDYYKKNPETNDLLQGPLMRRGSLFTNWDDKWVDGICGFWETDKRGIDSNAKPFEIKTQGMGMLSCRKDAFPKINPLFNGFGGEEKYIQEKFRRRRGKTLCLPFLRWHHRFDNKKPGGVNYPCISYDRIRNNFISYLELGWDLKPIFEHFGPNIEYMNKIYKKTVKELRDYGRKDIVIDPRYIKLGNGIRQKYFSLHIKYVMRVLWKISAILKRKSKLYRNFVKLINDNT